MLLWRLVLFLKQTPLHVRMAEAHLQTPPIVYVGKQPPPPPKRIKIKTAPTNIHVVCKQPKLQYGIESLSLVLSHYLYDQDCRGSVSNCIHPTFAFSSPLCKKKASLNSLKLFLYFEIFWGEKKYIWYQHGFLVIFLEYIQYFLKKRKKNTHFTWH